MWEWQWAAEIRGMQGAVWTSCRTCMWRRVNLQCSCWRVVGQLQGGTLA